MYMAFLFNSSPQAMGILTIILYFPDFGVYRNKPSFLEVITFHSFCMSQSDRLTYCFVLVAKPSHLHRAAGGRDTYLKASALS